jgi:Fe-S cluster assembly protein SufD
MAGIGRALEDSAPVSRLHELASFDVADFPVPTGREEEWRFTPMRRLRDLAGDTPLPPGRVTVETDPAPGVMVDFPVRGSAGLGRSFLPADRVSARAYASFDRATAITVPAELTTSQPTVVRVRGTEDAGVAFGHLLVDVRPMAQAVLVLDHAGNATYADNVEIVVGDGASLTMVTMQDWADDAVHLSHHYVTLGRDATIRHSAVSLGGGLVRLAPSVKYAGPGGDAEFLGMYFADAGQHLEHRLYVDHTQPNCRSRVDYRGALQGKDAHAVWIGDVIIRPEATGTDTYERNRNLVLTDETRVDSVPNLEILTGEVVGAGHASASGRLEDQHLFYLMARGIPEPVARRLVIRGFFGSLIDRMGVPQIAERIAAGIEMELA